MGDQPGISLMGRPCGYTHDMETRRRISESMREKEVVVSKHCGRIDDSGHRGYCSCGAKFKNREYRYESYNDLIEHYQKKGKLYRYLPKPHFMERLEGI